MILFCTLTFTSISPHSANIFVHFHYLNLLSQSNQLLSLLDKKKYYYEPCNCTQQKDCIQIDSTFFSHPRTKACINIMQQEKSLKPAIELSNTFENYSYVQDTHFIHELFILIFIIHKQILLGKCIEKPQAFKKVTLEKILEISEKINQLPIAEILNAIDMLVTELPPFLEKYEFNSKISWKEWLKKYWWVPPLFGGWFALKILLSLQRPHYYFSPYLSPRPSVPLPPIITNDPALAEIIVERS